MRDMTREKVEQFATSQSATEVNLALCEDGIAEGRRIMAEMLGRYQSGPSAKSEVRAEAKPEPKPAPVEEGKCPLDKEEKLAWTKAGTAVADAAVERVTNVGKFDADRAAQLTEGVAEERARDKRIQEIGESFMKRLGKQLGYGHPLSMQTSEYEFTWTPEAEARLEEIPEFCREMTRWRVEWTAVKKELGFVITPEIMDAKYEMWGEVSEDILNREESALDWSPETMGRLERIPDFVKGQVIQSVEGNARQWGIERIDDSVLDRVIGKWIDTGDFHEGKYGYK